MALQRQNVEYPLFGGLDDKVDPKVLPPGSLGDVLNGRLAKAGALEVRKGWDVVTTTDYDGSTALSGWVAVHAHIDELVACTETKLYSRLDSGHLVHRGTLPEAELKWRRAVARDGGKYSTQPSVGYDSGSDLAVIAYNSYATAVSGTSEIRASIYDAATGAFAETNVLVSVAGNTPVYPRVAVTTDEIVVFWGEATAGIRYRVYTPSTRAWGSVTTLIGASAIHASRIYDVVVEGGKYHLCYPNAPATSIACVRVDAGLGSTTSMTVGSLSVKTLSGCIANGTDGDQVWVAWAENPTTTVSAFAYAHDGVMTVPSLTKQNITTSSGLTSTVHTNIGVGKSGDDAVYVFWSQAPSGSAHDSFTKWKSITHAGSVGLGTAVGFNTTLTGSPFYQGGQVYYCAVGGGSIQQTAFLCEARNPSGVTPHPRVVTKWAQAEMSLQQVTQVPTRPALIGARGYLMPAVVSTRLQPRAAAGFWDDGRYEIDLVKFDFNVAPYRMVQLDRGAFVSGGVVSEYTGTLTEAGWHLYPEFYATAVGSGGSMAAGTYRYAWTYEWIDQGGKLHRSAPSPEQAVTVVLNDSVSHSVACLPFSQRGSAEYENSEGSAIRMVLYRSAVNDAAGPLYRVTPLLSQPESAFDVIAKTVVDDSADSAITSNEQLYTFGGVLENIEPPAPLTMTTHGNRVWVVPAEYPRRVWFSREFIPTEGLAWSDGLYVELPEPVVAMASMDAALILFSRDHIYAVYGDGPNDTGGGGAFSAPQVIQSNLGCTNARATAVTAQGIIFQSEDKLYLLGRDRQVSYIGAPVEDQLNSQDINAALVRPAIDSVEFALDEAGKRLCYNYHFGKWTRFQDARQESAVSLTELDGRAWFASDQGDLNQESTTDITDDATQIDLQVVTPWFRLAGLSGYQRVRAANFFGELIGNHDVSIETGYDFSDSYTDTMSWTAAEMGALTNPKWSLRVRPTRQKCRAIRFRITLNGTNTPMAKLHTVQMEVGIKRGLAKLPAGNKR